LRDTPSAVGVFMALSGPWELPSLLMAGLPVGGDHIRLWLDTLPTPPVKLGAAVPGAEPVALLPATAPEVPSGAGGVAAPEVLGRGSDMKAGRRSASPAPPPAAVPPAAMPAAALLPVAPANALCVRRGAGGVAGRPPPGAAPEPGMTAAMWLSGGWCGTGTPSAAAAAATAGAGPAASPAAALAAAAAASSPAGTAVCTGCGGAAAAAAPALLLAGGGSAAAALLLALLLLVPAAAAAASSAVARRDTLADPATLGLRDDARLSPSSLHAHGGSAA
jgi:hypothetical protein